MRTHVKSLLALVLALLICVSVFAACKKENAGDDTSSDTATSSIPTVSLPVVSDIQIDVEKGEIEMPANSTFADLKADMAEKGLLEEGQVVHLYQEDKVTEITDETTKLESGMVVIIKDADDKEVKTFTLTVAEEVGEIVSQVVNSDGTVTVYTDEGQAITVEVDSQGQITSVVSTASVPVPSATPGTSTPSVVTPSTNPGGNTSGGGNGGNDNPGSTDSGTNPGPSETTSFDTSRIQLKVAGDSGDNSLVMAVMAFQREHSNVRITIVPAEGGGKYTTLDGLKMQLASNNAPDVAFMDCVYVAAAGSSGYLLDLNEYGARNIRSKFIDSCWNSATVTLDGKEYQFGLPFDCNTILQFYNKDLLDEAGVSSAPGNWNEMTEAMEKLKSLSKCTNPFTLMINFTNSQGEKNYMAFQWMMFLWRLGGDVLSPDLKTATFNSQAGIDALQMYVDMVTKYGVSKDRYDVAPFFNGTAGFSMMTNNLYKDTVGNTQSPIHFGVTMLPELKAGVPRWSGLGLYTLALPNNITAVEKDANKKALAEAKAKAAYDFAAMYTSTLNYQMTYCNSTLLMPSLKEGQGSGQFVGDYWTVAYNQLNTSRARPGVKNWDAIESYIAQAINDAVNNVRQPKAALDAAATQTNRQLR